MRTGHRIPNGAFVFPSNVDRRLQKAGFAPGQVVGCHGSIHHMQYLDSRMDKARSAYSLGPEENESTSELPNDLPSCPHCGGVARPAILMFGQREWIDQRQRLNPPSCRDGATTLKDCWSSYRAFRPGERVGARVPHQAQKVGRQNPTIDLRRRAEGKLSSSIADLAYNTSRVLTRYRT